MTTTDEFAAPASSTGITFADYKGALLMFDVKSVESDVQTSFGPKDAVRADVTVIDGDGAGDVFNDALIFPSVLIGQIRSAVGKKVLGRLEQGNAKPGQQPPWKLADPTEADKTAARAQLAKAPDLNPPF